MLFKTKRYIITMIMQNARKFKLPAAALVALSFLVIIIVGTSLLCLPFAARGGKVDFLTSFFTATSASCVTGLVVADTFTHWSYFGQIVILLLIQVGGLGFITIMSLFTLYLKKHTSLSQRKLAAQSVGSINMVSTKSLVKIILLGTLIIEFCGAFLLSISFIQDYGWGMGIWQAVFTSVSAFCNAGFTITGANGGNSLCNYLGNPLVLLVVSLLIITGGIGFFVWSDVVHHGIHIKKYSFHSKIVFTVTGALIIFGWIFFGIFEWKNPYTIGNEGAGTKILAALFLSVTPRTAGFNIIDYAGMSPAGMALTDVFMLIGGSPGSTAGGMKTTTIAVFFLSMLATARRKEEVQLYKRRFENDAAHQAGSIFGLYVLVAVLSVFLICGVEGSSLRLDFAAFEVASAVGTVGLSCGITAGLHAVSKLVLILLMFFGRVGGFTLMLLFTGDKKPVAMSRVPEHIIVG